MLSDEFRQAIETIKLRAPIEDVVRERVPGLRRAGSLFAACCPFHTERTPSFKVDPRRGTWHCFGACSEGGDAISFVMRFDGLEFLEALEVLAAQTGVELPRRRGGRDPQEGRHAALYDVLQRAERAFARALAGPEGADARAYLAERGLASETVRAFGLGWAPAGGQHLLELARGAGIDAEVLVEAGLARRNDRGRPYDFFRGRLTIPIRDLHGRVVGFGARRLADDDAAGPKYVNTPETPLFHKARLVYGLDRAIRDVRRGKHAVLVEGYTDVMAAHQVGATHVVAVLGTSTTDDHAALLRRTGARRISLVFDGDEAGHAAAARALEGLLPLDVDIDVCLLEEGRDPCELCVDGGAAELTEALEGARDWFDFLTADLVELSGRALSEATDRVLALLERLSKPVHREARLGELAARLDMPVDALRRQAEALPERRRIARARGSEGAPTEPAAERPAPPERPRDPRLRRAFGELCGALLCDASLLAIARPWIALCPEPDLAVLLETIDHLDAEGAERIDADTVLSALGDAPERALVSRVAVHAETAESPRVLLEGGVRFLSRWALRRELLALERRIAELEDAPTEGLEGEPGSELLRAVERFAELKSLELSDPSQYVPETLTRAVSAS